MYQGAAGIDVLNNALQECFNPPDPIKRQVKIGYTVFREGDKLTVFGEYRAICETFEANEHFTDS